jgi:hypothetical protein
MKETVEDTGRRKEEKISYVPGLTVSILKMSTILKAIYRFIVIPLKIPISFCGRNRKINIKIHMEV